MGASPQLWAITNGGGGGESDEADMDDGWETKNKYIAR